MEGVLAGSMDGVGEQKGGNFGWSGVCVEVEGQRKSWSCGGRWKETFLSSKCGSPGPQAACCTAQIPICKGRANTASQRWL